MPDLLKSMNIFDTRNCNASRMSANFLYAEGTMDAENVDTSNASRGRYLRFIILQ